MENTKNLTEDLINQCMASGWFTSRESAERYVLKWCMHKPEPEYNPGGEDVFPTENTITKSKYARWIDNE